MKITAQEIYEKRTLKKMPESKSLEIYNQTINYLTRNRLSDNEISDLIQWSPFNINQAKKENDLGKTIIVLGAARGGTSAVSGILRIWGIYMGNCIGQNHEDPEMLKTKKDLAEIIETIKKRNRDYQDWGWKAPNSIFGLEEVMDYLRNTHFIMVVRHPLSMAKSQVKRSGADLQTGLYVSIGYYNHIATFLKSVKPKNIIFISYEDLISSKEEILQQISDFCGLELDKNNIKAGKEFLEPGNYREIKTKIQ